MLAKSASHLQQAGESWSEHRRFAWFYAGHCLAASFMALIHGLMPAWFETSASDRVKMLADPDRLRAAFHKKHP